MIDQKKVQRAYDRAFKRYEYHLPYALREAYAAAWKTAFHTAYTALKVKPFSYDQAVDAYNQADRMARVAADHAASFHEIRSR